MYARRLEVPHKVSSNYYRLNDIGRRNSILENLKVLRMD